MDGGAFLYGQKIHAASLASNLNKPPSLFDFVANSVFEGKNGESLCVSWMKIAILS